MTEEERWRLWKGAVALGMVLTLAAMAVALATKSLAGVVMVLVVTSALMMFLLLTVPRRKVVPPHLVRGLVRTTRAIAVNR